MRCFDHHKKNDTNCLKEKCRYWINCDSKKNCCIIAASENKNITLQEIGAIFGVTRMRICQIEKSTLRKIKDKISNFIK